MAKRKRSTYVLTEPDWSKYQSITDEQQREKAFQELGYFVHYEIADKTLIKSFKEWMRKKSGWDKQDITNILKLTDSTFSHVGKYAFIESKVGYMPTSCVEFIEKKKEPWARKGAEKIEASEEKPKVVRIRENLPNALEYIEKCVDDFIETGKVPVNWNVVSTCGLNRAETQELFDILGGWKGELEELQTVRQMTNRSDWDEQLVEGYSHISKPNTKKLIQMYTDVETSVMQSQQAKKITRIRKKRPTDKNKVVKRLRFLKEFKELDIVSINPVDIIGSSEVWYYDVKRKRLGVYASDFAGGLGVKGTAIENYGTTSYEKTVRKPEEVIPKFMACRINGLHKFMESVRGKKMTVRTRVQPNSVLLKVKQ